MILGGYHEKKKKKEKKKPSVSKSEMFVRTSILKHLPFGRCKISLYHVTFPNKLKTFLLKFACVIKFMFYVYIVDYIQKVFFILLLYILIKFWVELETNMRMITRIVIILSRLLTKKSSSWHSNHLIVPCFTISHDFIWTCHEGQNYHVMCWISYIVVFFNLFS